METLNLIKNDPWLEPFEDAIKGRHQHALDKEAELTNKGKQTLSDFASGYLYFGLHRTADGWVFREWAPNATEIFMVGTFNEWKELKKYSLKRKDYGVWEIKLPADAMRHGDLYKLIVHWEGGCGERIPAWATRVVQDEHTKIFSAQVWAPEKPYKVKKRTFKPNTDPLLIYECHIGMAQQEEKVGTYNEFREKTLPRIAKAGYNCIQIMAIQEHPYYGSFGYHVSSFFAASSRFGTPEELKELIDTAHGLGIAVITDAMALAEKYGKNKYIWDNNVADYILLKSNEEYFNDPLCKNGYFRGVETFKFVKEVISRGEVYKSKIKH